MATDAVFVWGAITFSGKDMGFLVHVVRDVLPTVTSKTLRDALPANSILDIVLDIERVRSLHQQGKTTDPIDLTVRYRNLGATTL